jgi:hypothetical protein
MYAEDIGSASDLSENEWEEAEPVGVGKCED